MTDHVLIPLPGIGTLKLTREIFEEALTAGAALNAPQAAQHAVGPALLSADQFAEHLSVPVSWIEEQARQEAIPSLQLGRYKRFDLEAVLLFLQDQRIVSASSASKPAKTLGKNRALQIRSGDFRPRGTGAKAVQ